ncbi:MAG: hypothetical protein R3D31_03500 [Hyphomicrobiaceae bacterium]
MSSPDSGASGKSACAEQEYTKRVTAAGWTAGVSAFFILGTMIGQNSWPSAATGIGVAVMVAIVCSLMLRRP